MYEAGLLSPGVPGVPWPPQILADQLTLSQPRGAGYADQIILAPPDFQTFLRLCEAKKQMVTSRINISQDFNLRILLVRTAVL